MPKNQKDKKPRSARLRQMLALRWPPPFLLTVWSTLFQLRFGGMKYVQIWDTLTDRTGMLLATSLMILFWIINKNS